MDIGIRYAALSILGFAVAAFPALGADSNGSRGGPPSSAGNPADTRTAVDPTGSESSSSRQGRNAQGQPTKAPDTTTGPDASNYRPGTKQQNDTAPIVKHSGHVDF